MPDVEKGLGPVREYAEIVADVLAEYGLTELPPAFLCKFDGSVHRRGIWHEGDTPLVPATRVLPPEVCSACGGSSDSPPCSLNRDLGLSGHTRAGGVAAGGTRVLPPADGDAARESRRQLYERLRVEFEGEWS